MIPKFNFGTVNLAEKVVQSTSVLMSANGKKIRYHNFHDDIFFGGTNKNGELAKTKLKVEELEKNFEFRTALFCALVNPGHFSKYGNVKNWYDTESLCDQLNQGIPVYSKEGIPTLAKDIEDQMPFIVRVQFSGIDITRAFPQDSIERYKKFMGLVKKYEGIHKLKAPADIEYVMKAHMLDRADYVSATKKYFGHELDYDNSPKTPQKKKQLTQLTDRLWEKHYGSINDSYYFHLWYNHFYTIDTMD